MDLKRTTYPSCTLMALARAPSGEVRAGVWDRFTTWGPSHKDGQDTTFDEVTTRQILDNFRRRSLLVPMDYNHQNYKVGENGQPAVSLARYGALAVVRGGQLLGMEALPGVIPAPLEEHTRGDGVYGYRVEVTPRGQEVLPNMLYISPAFNPAGTDEQGNPCGYVLECVAATDVPFQGDRGDGAPQITFALEATMFRIVEDAEDGAVGISGPQNATKDDYLREFPELSARIEKGTLTPGYLRFYNKVGFHEGTMKKPMMDEGMRQRMGLEPDDDDEKTKAAFVRRMDQGRAMMGRRMMGETMKPDEMRMMAKQFEEEAQAYEDNYGAEQMADGMEPVHVTMRKMAQRMTLMANGDGTRCETCGNSFDGPTRAKLNTEGRAICPSCGAELSRGGTPGTGRPYQAMGAHREPDGDEMPVLQDLATRRGIDPRGKSRVELMGLIEAAMTPPSEAAQRESVRRIMAEEEAKKERRALAAEARQMFDRLPSDLAPRSREAVRGQLDKDPATAIALMEGWVRPEQYGSKVAPLGRQTTVLMARDLDGKSDPEAHGKRGTTYNSPITGGRPIMCFDAGLADMAKRYLDGTGKDPRVLADLEKRFGGRNYLDRTKLQPGKPGYIGPHVVLLEAQRSCEKHHPHLSPLAGQEALING